jgi:hypothetical protein
MGCLLAAAPVAAAEAEASPAATAPAENIRIPLFTDAGFRLWLIRGSTLRRLERGGVEVTDLHLTAFSGDKRDRIESVMLGAAAKIDLDTRVVRGDGPVRVLNYVENSEAAGTGWTYDQRQKRISIAKNVSVTLHFELKDLLK